MHLSPLQTLINLVSFDQQIRQLKITIQELLQQLEQICSHKKLIEDELLQHQRSIVNAHKDIDAQELELKALDVRILAQKEKLEQLGNYKEYHAIKQDLDSLYHQQQEQEQRVMMAWNTFENGQKTFALLEPKLHAQIDEIEQQVKDKEKEIASAQEYLLKLQQQRPTLEKEVPLVWQEKYILMQERVADPVVPVVQGSCGACFYKLTGQDIASVRQKQLVQCKGCYRLMYLAEVHETALSV